MKHVIVIGFLLTGMALPAESATMECVTVQSCPKEAKPPACCTPPPCELFEQIRMKSALQRLYNKPDVHDRLIRKAKGDKVAAATVLNKFVVNESGKLGSKLRCPWKAPYAPPPGFETNSECQIVARLPGGPETMSRETALRTLNTCSEFVEAAYDHEKFHKDICMRSNSTQRAKMGITEYAAEESGGYDRELESLRNRLRQYWSACSAQADAKLARQVAAAGIEALKGKSPRKGG